jgi:YNFM family putative membrane transporter
MTAGAATISVPISVPISATISAAISAATRRSIFLLSLAAFSSMAAPRHCAAKLAARWAQAAQVVSIFAVVYGLSQLFYGPLGDRLGKFRIVTYATLWGSVGSVVAIFASSLDMLLVARALRRRQHREAS